HHIKKENIGLIEVMGLAVLPARLKNEMALMEDAILNGKVIRTNDVIAKHADWIDEWKNSYDLSSGEKIHEALKIEIGKTFARILGCAGVYKNDVDFMRFISIL
ncbi:MAG: galactose-1-phosphate uridylyltransferase, partial [Clostridiales bacterium]|nr:galactose-1-phosphate uridylyltransferase [Clostridiales bacterium]